jgi:predicted DNA-binding transcriptional regulator AlpA
MQEKIMVTLKGAGELLSLSRSSIYRLVSLGKLKPRKIHNRTLFLVSEIESFVSSLPETHQG